MQRTVLFILFLFGFSFSALGSENQWYEAHSPHFTVLTDSNEKQARKVAGQFERMRSLFQAVMPGARDTSGAPIVVLALKDRKSFQTVEPEAYLAKGQLDLAGYFMRAPDKNYILLRMDAQGEHPFATVYHEYTHYMTQNAEDWIPLWLNEGLAEFYQNTDIEDKEVLLGQPSTDDILYLRQNRLLPIPTLLAVDQNSPYYHEEQKGSVFYAESWALTHYLEVTDRQHGTNHIRDYAEHLIKKEDSITAAREAFGDLNQLQNALNSYISQGQFMLFKANTAITVDESAFQIQQVSRVHADAIRADVLVYNSRIKDAQSLIDSVLLSDPNNELAHETMGYIKFKEGDLQAAQKWYSEAVKLDSQSYLAHYYYATMSMGMLGTADNNAIEASLRACIKLNPTFAPAYDALARLYFSDPTNAQEAHLLGLQAVSLEPDNLSYRLNVAAQLENMRDYDKALQVLNVAKHIAKTSEDLATIERRIDNAQHYKEVSAQHAQAASVNEAVTSSQGPVTYIEDTRTMTIINKDGHKLVLRPSGPNDTPLYPTEPLTTPHHTATGVLHNVHCSYPKILVLQLDKGNGNSILLYRNDFYQIEFTVSNFTPPDHMNPCTDIEGLNGKVEYSEVTDKTVGGQIIAIELSK